MTNLTCKFRPSRIPKPAAPPPPARRDRLARQLALAYHVEELIESGHVESYAAMARVLGLTRARLTQVMNLLLLAPELQERVLLGDPGVTGRGLRRVITKAMWLRP